jgi:hypothetical protein
MRNKTRRATRIKGGDRTVNTFNPMLSNLTFMENEEIPESMIGKIYKNSSQFIPAKNIPNKANGPLDHVTSNYNQKMNKNGNLAKYSQNKVKNSFLTRTRKGFRQLPFFKQTPFTEKSTNHVGYLTEKNVLLNNSGNPRRVQFNNSRKNVQYYPINNSSHLNPTPALRSGSLPSHSNVPKFVKNAFARNAHIKANIFSEADSYNKMVDLLSIMPEYQNRDIDPYIKELALELAYQNLSIDQIVAEMYKLPQNQQHSFLKEYRKQRIARELAMNSGEF